MEITKTLAIARYEFKLLWRQRIIPILVLVLAALPLIFGFFIRSELSGGTGFFAEINPEGAGDISQSVTATVQWFSWAAIYLILTIMAPLVMSAQIPRDRQLGVRDLLDGLPLPPGVYLNGKLLGAWTALFASLLGAMGVALVGWRLQLGAVHIPSVVSLWLVGGSAVIVLNTGLAVLLAAGQPTRRRAYLVSGLFNFVTLLFYVRANTSLDNTDPTRFAWWQFFTPDRSPMTTYFLFQNIGLMLRNFPGVPAVSINRVWQTVLAGLLELALVWFVARRYVRTR